MTQDPSGLYTFRLCRTIGHVVGNIFWQLQSPPPQLRLEGCDTLFFANAERLHSTLYSSYHEELLRIFEHRCKPKDSFIFLEHDHNDVFFLRFATILTNNFNLKLQNCCALKTRKIARCIFILAISPGVTVLETKSADGWVMGQVVWDERDFFPRQVYSYVISLISKENSGL